MFWIWLNEQLNKPISDIDSVLFGVLVDIGIIDENSVDMKRFNELRAIAHQKAQGFIIDQIIGIL